MAISGLGSQGGLRRATLRVGGPLSRGGLLGIFCTPCARSGVGRAAFRGVLTAGAGTVVRVLRLRVHGRVRFRVLDKVSFIARGRVRFPGAYGFDGR